MGGYGGIPIELYIGAPDFTFQVIFAFTKDSSSFDCFSTIKQQQQQNPVKTFSALGPHKTRWQQDWPVGHSSWLTPTLGPSGSTPLFLSRSQCVMSFRKVFSRILWKVI